MSGEPPAGVPDSVPAPLITRQWGVSRVASIAILIAGSLVFIVIAKHVVLPVVLGLLASFLLSPLVRLLVRLRLPRPLAAAAVLGALLAALLAGAWSVSGPAVQWIERLPQSMGEVREKLSVVRRPVEQVTRLAQSMEDATGTGSSQSAVRVSVSHGGWAHKVVSHLQVGASDLLFATILAFFLLTSGDKLPRRISNAFSARNASLSDSCIETGNQRCPILKVIDESESTMSAYLLTVTWINLALGSAIALACWLLDMPNPLLWGAMAFVLNYIPYFGAVMGVITLAMAGLLSFDDLGRGLAPAGAYFVLNLMESELLTPFALQRRFSLDPVVTVIWTALWLWLWGIPGGILAVPLLVLGATICRNVTSLRPLSEILSP